MTANQVVRLVDPTQQYRELKSEIDDALARVLSRGVFTPDREVAALESELATWIDAPHVVAVSSGTAALQLSLEALGIARGDEVAVTANLDISAVAPITHVGAEPVWIDIDPASHTMSASSLEERLTTRTRAILVVHLQGFPADMESLAAVANAAKVPIIEDATHGPGASYRGRKVGTYGAAGCFSFAPTKPLGALGNAGAVVTRSTRMARRVRTLANYGFTASSISAIRSGEPGATFEYETIGTNATLDELQAAVVRVKLRHIDEWVERRRRRFALYRDALRGVAHLQEPEPGSEPAPRACVMLHRRRSEAAERLRNVGIQTGLQYVPPLHLQTPYGAPSASGQLPVTESVASKLLCLPVAPELPIQMIQGAASSAREIALSLAD